MTIVEKLKNVTLSATGLPVYVAALGLVGTVSRWVSGTETPGQTVSVWEPSGGALSLTAPAGSEPSAVSITESGETATVVRTDGVADRVSTDVTGVVSVTYLVRCLDPAGTTQGVVNWSGGHLQRGSSGVSAITRIGASMVTMSTGVDGPLFHTVTVVNDGANSGTFIDGEYDAQPADRVITVIGVGNASSNYGQVDTLEVLTFDHAVDATEHGQVRAAMQAKYPGLVA